VSVLTKPTLLKKEEVSVTVEPTPLWKKLKSPPLSHLARPSSSLLRLISFHLSELQICSSLHRTKKKKNAKKKKAKV
jgi:hypothetical protein